MWKHKNKGAEWWDTPWPLSMGPVLSDICRKFTPPQVNLQQAKKFPRVLGNLWICYYFFLFISLFSSSPGELRQVLNGKYELKGSSEWWWFLAGSLETKSRYYLLHSHWVLICPLQGLCAPQSVSLTFSNKWSVFSWVRLMGQPWKLCWNLQPGLTIERGPSSVLPCF